MAQRSSLELSHVDKEEVSRMFQSARQMQLRFALLWLTLWISWGLLPAGFTQAQPVTSAPATPPSTSVPLPTEDVIYLPDEQGVLRRVPLNASLQDYLAWQKQLSTTNTDTATAYAIQSLDIQGQLVTLAESRQFVDLIINIDVQVYQPTWTLINLKLQELVFTEPLTHQGPGEIAFNQRDKAQGVTLWIKGKGVHRLQIKGMLPVRSQQLWKRLQLTVPSSTVSEFRMNVPAETVQLRDVERYPLAQTEANNGGTQIRLVDLQERLDVSWLEETNSSRKDPLVNVINNLTVRIIEQQLEMTLIQRLEISKDPITTLVGKLPPGWDYYDVKADRGTIIKQQPISAREIQLELERPVSGRIELTWQMRRPLPAANDPLTIGPVEYPIAKRTITEISLQDHPEWQFQIPTTPTTDSSDSLIAPTIRQSASGPVYQFRSLPAVLPVVISPRLPTYSTVITAAFQPDKQQCKLTLYIDVKVTQGILRWLTLNWPVGLDRDWKLLSATEYQVKPSRNASNPLQKELTLTRGISDSSTIKLEFVRTLEPGLSSYELIWPTLDGQASLDHFLVITDSRQVETKVSGSSADSLSRVPRTLWRDTYAETSRLTPISNLYTVPADIHELSLDQTIIEQDITARLSSSIHLEDTVLSLTQTIDYRIEWSGTRQFDLDCPADFSGTFQLKQQGNGIITQIETLLQEDESSSSVISPSKGKRP